MNDGSRCVLLKSSTDKHNIAGLILDCFVPGIYFAFTHKYDKQYFNLIAWFTKIFMVDYLRPLYCS